MGMKTKLRCEVYDSLGNATAIDSVRSKCNMSTAKRCVCDEEKRKSGGAEILKRRERFVTDFPNYSPASPKAQDRSIDRVETAYTLASTCWRPLSKI